MTPDNAGAVESLYRGQRDRILATLIGLVHDFDLAEEMMHEAFAAAPSAMEGQRHPRESAGVDHQCGAQQGKSTGYGVTSAFAGNFPNCKGWHRAPPAFRSLPTMMRKTI